MGFTNLEGMIINLHPRTRASCTHTLDGFRESQFRSLIQLITQNRTLTNLEIKSRPMSHNPVHPKITNFKMPLPYLSNLKVLKLTTPSPIIDSHGIHTLLEESALSIKHLALYESFDTRLLEHLNSLESLETHLTALMAISPAVRSRLRHITLNLTAQGRADTTMPKQTLHEIMCQLTSLTSLALILPDMTREHRTQSSSERVPVVHPHLTLLRHFDLTMNINRRWRRWVI
jgi:hypothetical protein